MAESVDLLRFARSESLAFIFTDLSRGFARSESLAFIFTDLSRGSLLVRDGKLLPVLHF